MTKDSNKERERKEKNSEKKNWKENKIKKRERVEFSLSSAINVKVWKTLNCLLDLSSFCFF